MSYEWSNDDIKIFLDYYQQENCLWDPTNPKHKDKKYLLDSWTRISFAMGKSIKELKTKKDILMALFRRHLKKKRESIHSGAGSQDIYEPNWFPYTIMESFLLQNYTSKATKNTENIQDEDKENSPGTSKKSRNKRSRSPDQIEVHLSSAINELQNSLKKAKEDPIDNIGILIASLIKKLHPEDQVQLSNELITHCLSFRGRQNQPILSDQVNVPAGPVDLSQSSQNITNEKPKSNIIREAYLLAVNK